MALLVLLTLLCAAYYGGSFLLPNQLLKHPLRQNPPDTAEWELRIGALRVFYNVDESVKTVSIERFGEKPNNTVFFRGQES